MTEEEAKTKWCPFVRLDRVVSVGGYDAYTLERVSYNRLQGAGTRGLVEAPATHCIASACMAWRGSESSDFKRRAETAFRREGTRLQPGPDDTVGFCGLAGPPQ